MRYVFIYIFFILVPCLTVRAQSDTSHTPPKDSPFNRKTKIAFNRDKAFFENVFKFEPTMLIRNAVCVGYDRYIKNVIGVSFGIGFYYDFDPLLKLNYSSSVLFNPDPFKEYLSFSQIVNVKKQFSSGFTTQFAAKWYFEKDDYFPGGYAEIAYRFSRLSYSFTEEDFFRSTGYILINNQPVNVVSNLFTASYGYQIHTNGKLKLIHDFSIGVGYRISSLNEIDKSDSFYNSAQVVITGQPVKKEATMRAGRITYGGIVFNIVYTIGIGF
jgi:hypothetical protein